MSVVVTSFINDESAHHSNATKNKVHHRHFNWRSPQISEQWRAATVLEKAYVLTACYEIYMIATYQKAANSVYNSQ